MTRRDLLNIEKQWEHTSKYHLIPTAQSLRRLLFERIPECVLDQYDVWIGACEVCTRDAYLDVALKINGHPYILQNIGYTERPRWQISGHDRKERWLRIEFDDTVTDFVQQINCVVQRNFEQESDGRLAPPRRIL